MKGKVICWAHGFIILAALGLTACGGGGGTSSTACNSGIAGLCETLNPAGMNTAGSSATAGGTTTGGTTAATTAPAEAFAILPATLTTSDCTTNIPFVFSGGTGPFTIFTSDLVVVPVSAALPLGSKNYFLASVRSLFLVPDEIGPPPKVIVPRRETVTVLDSQANTATAIISVASGHFPCPSNPLLQIDPASANAHVTEVLAFQISGGQAPYHVASSDSSIVTVPAGEFPEPTFTAQAAPSTRATQETALLTVTSADGQNASIRFTVLPR